ncbi:MAG: PAS domain S-box protein [Anaerolineae bacterium]|nr:PAS domain S-box protein [Anaerolineae bacterium]
MDELKTKEQLLSELAQARQRIAELEDLEAERLQVLHILHLQNRAMESTGNGIVIVDANQSHHPVIYCNPAFSHITGYSIVDVMDENCRFLQGPDTDPAAVAQIRQAIRQQTDCQVIIKNYRKDGTPFWNELTISPVRDRQGNVTHFVGIQNDITHRKQTEEQLRANEERFRQVIYSISDHIYFTEISKDGTYTNLYLSPHVQTLTGYPVEELEADWNLWASQIIHPDDRARAAEQAKRLTVGIDSEIEYRITRSDGQIIWVRDSGRVTQEGESTLVYGVVSDITERKRAEKMQRQTQKMEAIGKLAGGVAHDFNNLLTVIYGQCELLLGEEYTQQNVIREEIEEIKVASEKAMLLTQQLLTFSRQRSNQSQVLNLNHIINQFKKMLQRLVGEDIDFVDNLAPDLSSIKADPGHIEQVLMNLVINARDAMPKGGALTIATANIQSTNGATNHEPRKSESYVQLTVSDTGIGIDKETKARMFEPFYTTKAVGKGTGLGLSTVYGIVQQNDGQIKVLSQPGQGTTFEIVLPAVDEPAPILTTNPTNPSNLMGNETILLVEDEANVRAITRKFLRKRGYNVIEAINVHDALEISRQAKCIDLLITDMIMPDMNGYELVKQLSHWQPDLKVLYISGYPDDVLDQHDILTEGIPLLEKPFSSEILARKVRDVLD